MTRPTLTVVEGGGKPEPDPEIIEIFESFLTRAKAGEFENVLVAVDKGAGTIPECVVRGEDDLQMICVAELLLHPAKMLALGYEPE
ncbi:hypothetical protein [Lysobacter panacisoli]|uniref:Uncharacterized protein n=1 Tax=Lysobacter panacisoli TaxID=1255263 RepID=A0ABP9LCE4_9GAMM|nr:hypothetical protein [Lysobacter panacisoli]